LNGYAARYSTAKPAGFQPANAAASVSAVLPFRNGSLCRRYSPVRGNAVPSRFRNGYARRCSQVRATQFLRLSETATPPVFAGAGSPVPSPFRPGYAPPVFAGAGNPNSFAFPKRLRRRCSQVRAAQFLRLSETATPPDVRQGSALPQTLKKTNGLCPWFGLGPHLWLSTDSAMLRKSRPAAV